MSALRLEVFDTPGVSAIKSAIVTDAAAMEDMRMQAYEQGYTAGWDDAAAAQSDDQTRIKADFALNLQSLGFTFQEARAHVLRAIEPLIHEIITHVLPQMGREGLASLALETLMPLADEMADAPLTLVLNPALRPAVEALLEQATGMPMTIIEEPTLGEGQAYIRLGDCETRIDLDRAIADIKRAARDFFDLSEQDHRYG